MVATQVGMRNLSVFSLFKTYTLDPIKNFDFIVAELIFHLALSLIHFPFPLHIKLFFNIYLNFLLPHHLLDLILEQSFTSHHFLISFFHLSNQKIY